MATEAITISLYSFCYHSTSEQMVPARTCSLTTIPAVGNLKAKILENSVSSMVLAWKTTRRIRDAIDLIEHLPSIHKNPSTICGGTVL